MKIKQQINHLEEVLKKNGYRITLPRKVIMEVFTRSKGHLNAKEIYLKINKKYPNIGLTTVYRTLDLLVRLKLLSRFEFGDGQHSYEQNSEAMKYHSHLICSSCAKVINCGIDEERVFFKRVQKLLSMRYNFLSEDFGVQIYGLCNSCRKENK